MKLVNSTLLITFLSHNASPLFYFVTSVIKIGCSWILILKNNWKMVWLITPSDSNAGVQLHRRVPGNHATSAREDFSEKMNSTQQHCVFLYFTCQFSVLNFCTYLLAVLEEFAEFVENCNFVTGITLGSSRNCTKLETL